MPSRYDIIKPYKKKKINEFYDGYIENIQLKLFKSYYVHPSKITSNDSEKRRWDIIAKKDKYIDQWKDDRVKLAEDILEHGNYFPFWVYKEDGELYISEGVHRLDSIKQAIKQGIWTNQKIFCIEIEKKWDVDEKRLNVSNLENEIEINLPAYNIEYGWFEKTFSRQLSRFNNKESFKKLKEDGNFKIKISTYDEYFNACKIYHKLMRHALYKHQQVRRERIEARFPLK